MLSWILYLHFEHFVFCSGLKSDSCNFIFQCVQVLFEIGHEATIRMKATPEGFTHDWEVFVRGADNTEINHFVDKVVFHLHETFPKPKRGKFPYFW
jgi:Transcription initiation factor IIF, auxiliary subunit